VSPSVRSSAASGSATRLFLSTARQRKMDNGGGGDDEEEDSVYFVDEIIDKRYVSMNGDRPAGVSRNRPAVVTSPCCP